MQLSEIGLVLIYPDTDLEHLPPIRLAWEFAYLCQQCILNKQLTPAQRRVEEIELGNLHIMCDEMSSNENAGRRRSAECRESERVSAAEYSREQSIAEQSADVARGMQLRERQQRGGGTGLEHDYPDFKRQLMIDTLNRVMCAYEEKVGYAPGNLRLFLRRITSPRWGWRMVYPDAAVILKGYFIWQSHVVQPTAAEAEMLRGFPARKSDFSYKDDSEEWKPDVLLDGSPGWEGDTHHVRLGDEKFSVSRQSFYTEP